MSLQTKKHHHFNKKKHDLEPAAVSWRERAINLKSWQGLHTYPRPVKAAPVTSKTICANHLQGKDRKT
jgi:hypothetical protein